MAVGRGVRVGALRPGEWGWTRLHRHPLYCTNTVWRQQQQRCGALGHGYDAGGQGDYRVTGCAKITNGQALSRRQGATLPAAAGVQQAGREGTGRANKPAARHETQLIAGQQDEGLIGANHRQLEPAGASGGAVLPEALFGLGLISHQGDAGKLITRVRITEQRSEQRGDIAAVDRGSAALLSNGGQAGARAGGNRRTVAEGCRRHHRDQKSTADA